MENLETRNARAESNKLVGILETLHSRANIFRSFQRTQFLELLCSAAFHFLSFQRLYYKFTQERKTAIDNFTLCYSSLVSLTIRNESNPLTALIKHQPYFPQFQSPLTTPLVVHSDRHKQMAKRLQLDSNPEPLSS